MLRFSGRACMRTLSAGMERFRDLYTPNPEDRTKQEVSPLLAEDLSGLPPALVITSEFDPLRDEGEAYADRLKKAGVKTTAKRYPGLVHGFVSVARFLPQAEQATAEVGAFLKQELKQPSSNDLKGALRVPRAVQWWNGLICGGRRAPTPWALGGHSGIRMF